MWTKVDKEIGDRLAKALEETNQSADHDTAPPVQMALAAHRK